MDLDPFNPVGRYRIETFIYDHKRGVLFSTLFVMILILGLMFLVWWSARG